MEEADEVVAEHVMVEIGILHHVNPPTSRVLWSYTNSVTAVSTTVLKAVSLEKSVRLYLGTRLTESIKR